jgi:putative membrane protein
MKNICQKMLSVIAILVLCLMCIANQFPLYSFAKEDDENVYGRMKPDGEIYKTIVNNEEQEDKELPIETEIKYYLDDEEISIDDLKGKSGKVKIAINLTNKDENTVNINGKNVTMYTPYIVGTSVILDNNKFSDVTISTGKVIDNGTDTVAIGIAMPGMQESLDLDIEDVEIPENITIEANCKDFELGNIYMYIQSDVFGSDSLDFLDEFESFYTDARELKSASTKLVDGTNSLKDGTKTYASKISEFNAGLSKYTSGVTSVRDNYEKIDSGISTINSSSKQIADGSNNLNNGIKELKSQLTTLVSGISQLQTGANAIDSGLGNIITSVEASINATSGSADISANLASLASATSQSISDLKATKASLQAVADAMSDTIPTLSADGSSITDEPNTAKTDILAQISALDAQITSLESNVNAERNAYQTALQATTASGLNDLLNGLQRLKVASSQVKSGLDNIVSHQL